jgi:hypothetical protein
MKKIVKKYLIPSEENEYKPHLLRETGIAFLAIISVAVFAIGVFQNYLFEKTSFLSAVLPPVLVDLANQNRADNQLALLTANPILEKVAQDKANDMASKGYFAHTNPSGKEFWVWFKEDGYNFLYAGENLAVNFSDSGEVSNAWMNSTLHRENILNGKFTEIGIATANGFYNGRPTVFIVQEFGRPQAVALAKPVLSKPAPVVTTVSVKPVALTTVANTPNKILGESATAPKQTSDVLAAPKQTFASVENADTLGTGASASDQTSSGASAFWSLFTAPKTFGAIYLVLAGLVIIAIAFMIGIEIKRQHPKYVIAGIILLIFIVALFYIYQNVLFGQVIVL